MISQTALDTRLLLSCAAFLAILDQLTTHGWDFLDNESAEPGITVRRTDLWSESNSGPGYSHDMPPEFETGFDYVLEAEFSGPGSGDHDAGDICVEFN